MEPKVVEGTCELAREIYCCLRKEVDTGEETVVGEICEWCSSVVGGTCELGVVEEDIY